MNFGVHFTPISRATPWANRMAQVWLNDNLR